ASVPADRGEDSGDRGGCADRIDQPAFTQPYLRAGQQIGRYRGDAAGQLLDGDIAHVLPVEVHEPPPSDHATATDRYVHQPEDVPLRESTHPRLEVVQLPCGVRPTDQRADRGPADDLRRDAALHERGKHTDVSPT